MQNNCENKPWTPAHSFDVRHTFLFFFSSCLIEKEKQQREHQPMQSTFNIYKSYQWNNTKQDLFQMHILFAFLEFPFDQPVPKNNCQCLTVTFCTSISVLYTERESVPLCMQRFRLRSHSLNCLRFCHGSCNWAYGSNSLLGIRSGGIWTRRISRLDVGCFVVNKYRGKWSVCMRMCEVFNAKPRGFLSLCPDWKFTLKYVVDLRCPYAMAYFWISFWLISCFSAPICLCTKCKFQRKISDIHQLIMKAKLRL